MTDHSASDHVQFDVAQAAPEVLTSFYQGRVEVVSPKRVQPLFAAVVGAGKLPCYAAHETTDFEPVLRIDQQVHMV
jgi:hypothetical protein